MDFEMEKRNEKKTRDMHAAAAVSVSKYLNHTDKCVDTEVLTTTTQKNNVYNTGDGATSMAPMTF